MNTLAESIFAQARTQWLEDVTSVFNTGSDLFTELPVKHRFYRMPYFTSRKYFTVDNGQPKLMQGLTGITKKIISSRNQDAFLKEWQFDMLKDGKDPDEYAERASQFGTLIHIVAANIFAARQKGESFSTHQIDRELLKYMSDIGISNMYFKEWYRNLCAAIRSLNNFYSKSEMKVLSIEHCVADFDNNICTPIDIICEMNYIESVDVPMKTKEGTKKEKQVKRGLWALNIKARQNPDRRSTDMYQLCAEQYIANGYLDILIPKTGVLSPSWTWRDKENADCKLHDFTGTFSEKDWQSYLKQFRNEPGGINNSMFNPDLSQRIGDSNVFTVANTGNILDMPDETIEGFILRHFKVD
ncbi:MAG TPA: hypothetical protein PLO82_12020 [Bacteroidia bacterium]|nr:hypothetical protein [Bacteroidia bacterium]